MDRLERCCESIDKVRTMLASDRLLTQEQMQEAVALIAACEQEASAFSNVLAELRATRLRVARCEVKSEFIDFLEAQYRSRGLSSPRKIAALVVLDDATNALKRASVIASEEMRRTGAA